MPATQHDTNPAGRKITFTEKDHSYIDNWGRDYTSITTLIHQYFPKFDVETHSKRTAEKENTTPEIIKARWEANSKQACDYGTRVHEMGEWRMKGENKRHEPRDEREKLVFASMEWAIDELKTKYQFVAAEKIVFSERARIAGTTDLLMSDGGILKIMDHKTNKRIRDCNQWGQVGLEPISHLQDCEIAHYALQLSMIEKIMKMEKYIPIDTPVQRELIHFAPDGKVQFIPTGDMEKEVTDLMLYHATRGFEEVPF